MKLWVLGLSAACLAIGFQLSAASLCTNGSGPCAQAPRGGACAIGEGRGACQAVTPANEWSECFCELRLYDREYSPDQLFARRQRSQLAEAEEVN